MTDTTQEPVDRNLAALYDEPAAPASTAPSTGEQPQQQAPPAPAVEETAATPAADDGPKNWAEARKSLDALSRENRDLKRKFQDLERRTPTPAADELPDPIVDPRAFADAFAQRQSDARFVERVELTRESMIESVGEEKFLAAEAAFAEAVAADPQLGHKLRNAPNPARFAFQTGNKVLESRAKPAADASSEMYAKMKAQLEAEFDLVPKAGRPPTPAAPAAPQQRAAPRLPTSLADVPAGGPRPQASKPNSGEIDLATMYGD